MDSYFKNIYNVSSRITLDQGNMEVWSFWSVVVLINMYEGHEGQPRPLLFEAKPARIPVHK